MKKYREYMDTVRASDTLHQRLLGLETSGKRPIPWKRYGTMAAALVLVVGLGAWGLGKAGGWAALKANFDPLADYTSIPEIADEPVPDIALAGPDDVTEPGEKTIGGYEVISGSGGNAMVTYYVLPYIDYGRTDGAKGASASLDWDIPKGAAKRDLTQTEIAALMGGEDAVNTHLDWGEYELTGWAAWYGDGSFWGAYVNGYVMYGGSANQFEFAVTADQLPPTCIVYPSSVTQEIRGLTVTADGYDAVVVDASTRRVSFMKDGYGYRFDINGTVRAQTEERVSRLVCHVADRGLDLSIFPGTTVPAFEPDYDPTYEDGVPAYDSDCPYCVDGTPHTHPYNPGDATYTCDICGHDFPVGSAHGHPFMGADSVCPNCGAVISAGADHDCVIITCPDCGVTYDGGTEHHCAGGTHTCDICGEVLPIDVEHSHGAETCPYCGVSYAAGAEHSHELCTLPVAPSSTPATYTCGVCGQTVQSGAAHSHSEGHHDDDHHGGHH